MNRECAASRLKQLITAIGIVVLIALGIPAISNIVSAYGESLIYVFIGNTIAGVPLIVWIIGSGLVLTYLTPIGVETDD